MFIQSSTSRRRFLASSLCTSVALGIDSQLPRFLVRAADSAPKTGERILVVVQLTGGNDGLNTLVPYANEAYRAARPKLALNSADVLKIDSELGLHPQLTGLHSLLEDGLLTIVQGVGYDQPNRSHFESMDIWHTCQRKGLARSEGWLGNYLDESASVQGGDVPGLHLGRSQQPLALAARKTRVPSITKLDEFRLQGRGSEALRELIDRLALDSPSTAAAEESQNDLLNFVQSSNASAMIASQRVAQAAQDYRTDIQYPSSGLGEKLRVVSQLIDAGLATRIYYVELDGFDTHAQQAQTHANLLDEWSAALTAFMRDIATHGHEKRVCVMTFSEFGRRLAENSSGGTDHGAAAPLFLCGGAVQPGLVGAPANLTELDDGDVQHSIDFRQVYASVLSQWMGVANPATILHAHYDTLPLFTS